MTSTTSRVTVSDVLVLRRAGTIAVRSTSGAYRLRQVRQLAGRFVEYDLGAGWEGLPVELTDAVVWDADSIVEDDDGYLLPAQDGYQEIRP